MEIFRIALPLLAALTVTSCATDSLKERDALTKQASLRIYTSGPLYEGLRRHDGFGPLYRLAHLFQVDSTAEFFNGAAPDPMNTSAVLIDAKAGDRGAQASLFFRYYYGVDEQTARKFGVTQVTRDVCTAANWLHKSARQNDPTALLWMAFIFERGDGVPRNPTQALYWYLAWLDAYKLREPIAFPLSPKDFGLTPKEFFDVGSGYEAWHAEEWEKSTFAFPACPGVGPKSGEKRP